VETGPVETGPVETGPAETGLAEDMMENVLNLQEGLEMTISGPNIRLIPRTTFPNVLVVSAGA